MTMPNETFDVTASAVLATNASVAANVNAANAAGFGPNSLPAGTPGQAFLREVLARHIAWSTLYKGLVFAGGVRESLLDRRLHVRKEIAGLYREVFGRMNTALEAKRSAVATAGGLVRVWAASSYRTAGEDFNIWRQTATRMGGATLSAITTTGTWGDAQVVALVKILRRVKAPGGFSKHQRGITIDFGAYCLDGDTLTSPSRILWRLGPSFHKNSIARLPAGVVYPGLTASDGTVVAASNQVPTAVPAQMPVATAWADDTTAGLPWRVGITGNWLPEGNPKDAPKGKGKKAKKQWESLQLQSWVDLLNTTSAATVANQEAENDWLRTRTNAGADLEALVAATCGAMGKPGMLVKLATEQWHYDYNFAKYPIAGVDFLHPPYP